MSKELKDCVSKYVKPKQDNKIKHESTIKHENSIKHENNIENENNTKQENFIKQPKDCQAVINFFEEKNFDVAEAKKFYQHYADRDWHTGDDEVIRDWRAVAINWMDRTELFETQNKNQASQIKDNLRTTKAKDYGQPL